MSGKVRQRASANPADSSSLTVNENILRECHDLYVDPENGLIKLADNVGLGLLAPRKKITILLIGNHSAGKSSFINWYVEEHVQKTGVAMETQGFTIVTSGRKKESLTGNATLHLYTHFEPLRRIKGVIDYLSTEICTSKQKKFSLVTFVDTPGLVDGDMKYPFDVNECIEWLGELADLIFVFFDPIGQALCKRTLNLVEKLSETHADRVKFYLSKADEAGHESDRQRVMMQIVQELCKRPCLNRTSFDMPTIYIPSTSGKVSRCVNQIEEVCRDIEKTISQTIQNTLNSLEKDCNHIAELIDDKLDVDSGMRSRNLRARLHGVFFTGLALFFPLLACFAVTDQLNALASHTPLYHYLLLLQSGWSRIPEDIQFYVFGAIAACTLLCLLIAKFTSSRSAVLTRREKRTMNENKDYVQTYIKKKKQDLYQKYLQQSVAEHDL